MSRLNLILLLSLVASNGIVILADNVIVKCNGEFGTIGEGILAITGETCVFDTAGSAFMIKTDDLALQDGESLKVSHKEGDKTVSTNFTPPFDTGYLFFNVPQPKLEFFVKYNATYNVYFKRYLNPEPNGYPFELNSNLNNDFKIKPYTFQEFMMQLTLKQTIKATLLEVSGATLQSSATGYSLHTGDPEKDLKIEIVTFKGNESVTFKTSRAESDCSTHYSDEDPNKSQRVIKVDMSHDRPYKCVWTFTASPESHYDIDFKDFLGLYNVDDELIIKDNSTLLKVHQTVAHDYFKRVLSSRGRDLAIIYSSQVPSHITATLVQLSVNEKNTGGVLETNAQSSIPLIGSGNFVTLPEIHNYAAIEFRLDANYSNTKIRILSENNLFANLENYARLPPVIALDEKDKAMFLEITTDDKAKMSISAKSLKESCHKTSKTTTDSFSVTGNSTCFWTIATTSAVSLRFDNLHLSPSSCITIQPFDLAKPVYQTCNGTLPQPFIVRGAYISVISNSPETRVDASITPWLQEDVKKFDKPTTTPLNITSTGYPLTYAIDTKPTTLSFNYTNSSYVLSIADVDLRKGESMLDGSVELKQYLDLIMVDNGKSKAIKDLTITRPQIPSDVNARRGYQLRLAKFDKVILANQTSKKPIELAQNLTSAYIKISSPLNNRIKFNSSNTSYMKIYDSSTLLVEGLQPIQGNISTSNTILITYQITAANATLPKITLDYEFVPCDKSAHVCDSKTRCIPNELLCKGKAYCQDGSDLKRVCDAGPAPLPEVIVKGLSGTSVFFLSLFMMIIGSLATLYGPNLYKSVEGRLRNGQYTSFSSTE